MLRSRGSHGGTDGIGGVNDDHVELRRVLAHVFDAVADDEAAAGVLECARGQVGHVGLAGVDHAFIDLDHGGFAHGVLEDVAQGIAQNVLAATGPDRIEQLGQGRL